MIDAPNSPQTIFALYNMAMVFGFYEDADTQAARLRALGYALPEREQGPAPVGLFSGVALRKPKRMGARQRKRLAGQHGDE